MLAKDINIKINDVPEGWSIEAADFINKVHLKLKFHFVSIKNRKLNIKIKYYPAIKEKKQ